MQLGMHTKRIQNAYKHIKRGKERNSSSTSSLYCLFLYLPLPVFQAIVFYCPRLQACTDPIKLHCLFFWVTVAVTLGGRSFER